MSETGYGAVPWERMMNALEKVRERLLRAAAALGKAGVPYAAARGNADAAWVSRVGEAAVRNTQDVDILVRRQDLDVSLVDETWCERLPQPLRSRLEMLLNNPEG